MGLGRRAEFALEHHLQGELLLAQPICLAGTPSKPRFTYLLSQQLARQEGINALSFSWQVPVVAEKGGYREATLTAMAVAGQVPYVPGAEHLGLGFQVFIQFRIQNPF